VETSRNFGLRGFSEVRRTARTKRSRAAASGATIG
jgi:hypothetical protein